MLKSSFGKYKKKEVDAYILEMELAYKEKQAQLEQRISELEGENASFRAEIARYKEKESVIAQVMLDATQRAKDIEEDYRKRADESDAACRQLHEEWVAGMQSAAMNLKKMREDAKKMLEDIDGQFSSLASWADMRLENLQGAALPESVKDESLEAEIKKGIGADLGDALKELGIEPENNEA